jgi:hypothetical protein
MRPDFRNYRGVGLAMLMHSAKGSTWEEHKYIKRIDGTYYYPDSYEGGRHLDNSDESEDVENESSFDLTSDEIDALAREVIRGNFANGQERKEALGEHYQEIQDRVNQLMKSSTGSTKVSEASEETVSTGTAAVTKVTSSSSKSSGIDLDKVFTVYRKHSSS